MEKTLEDRTLRARIICGAVAIAMGAVALGVNWPYLFGPGTGDPGAAWLSALGGVLGVAIGCWILAGPRSKGERLVLTTSRGRIAYGVAVFLVCLALLVGGLTLDQPTTSTGLPALLAGNAFLLLFVPNEQNR